VSNRFGKVLLWIRAWAGPTCWEPPGMWVPRPVAANGRASVSPPMGTMIQDPLAAIAQDFRT